MNKKSIEEVEELLWNLYLEVNRPLGKQDITDHPEFKHYNTFIRVYNVRLHELNKKFSEKKYNLSPVLCKLCGNSVPYKQRMNMFCCSSSAATFNNTGRVKVVKDSDFMLSGARRARYLIDKNDQGKFVVATTCINCGLQIAQGVKCDRKYCCLKCQTDYQFVENFRDWYEHRDNDQRNPALRKYLAVWQGLSCSVCGAEEWNGLPITLEVEHRSGDSSDNSPDNVCLICPNCHSQTPTYKARNKGNGRASRRLRYQQGKSY